MNVKISDIYIFFFLITTYEILLNTYIYRIGLYNCVSLIIQIQ